jgi:hypothetical protein
MNHGGMACQPVAPSGKAKYLPEQLQQAEIFPNEQMR